MSAVLYKVVIKPLEPYTFGTEQGSKYEGVEGTGKESYIIDSSYLPEQTTILGTLRYIVLKNKGLLKTDFNYTAEEKKLMTDNIGSRSFSFGGNEENFGLIKSVSPVFVTDTKNGVNYVANPYCNKEKEKGYKAFSLEEKEISTSKGMIKLPGKDYDVKEGYVHGFISLDKEMNIIKLYDLFSEKLLTGNCITNGNNNKEAFFKRKVIHFRKDNSKDYSNFAFAVYVNAENGTFPEKAIGYMGRKQSSFEFTFEKTEDEPIDEQVKKVFANADGIWYYALSDMYAPSLKLANSYAMIEQKKIRNLETVVDSSSYKEKRKKSNLQIHLIKAGSVFTKRPENLDISKYLKVGYNHIIQIGSNAKEGK